MNRNTLTKITVLVCTLVALGSHPAGAAIRAGHSTNYLDALQADVSNRLANADSGVTSRQKAALRAASSILKRNTRTLQQDLQEFSAASTVLNRAFADDAALGTLEEQTLASFIANVDAQRAALGVTTDVGSSGMPRAFSNQVAQADHQIDLAKGTNNVVARARALNLAIVKLRVATLTAARLIKAPASLADKVVTLTESAARNRTTIVLAAGNTYTSGDETGAWNYVRTGANTGTVTLAPTGGATTRTLDLTFRNATTGSFREEDASLHGTFRVTDAP